MLDRVLHPLGMTDSCLSAWRPDGTATGHLVDRDRVHVVRDSAVLVPGAGDLVSTVGDLAQLLVGLLPTQAGQTPALLTNDTIAMMNAGEVTVSGHQFRQGIGVRTREISGHLAVGHSGSWPDYRAELWWMPDRRAGVAALANTDTCGLPGLVTDILQAI